MTAATTTRRVIAGPAGHWYALWLEDEPDPPESTYTVHPFGDEPLFDDEGVNALEWADVRSAAAYAADTRKDWTRGAVNEEMRDFYDGAWFAIHGPDTLAGLVTPDDELLVGARARIVYDRIGTSGDWPEGDVSGAVLVGRPIYTTESRYRPPLHPAEDEVGLEGWGEITDPAPDTDVEALIALLQIKPGDRVRLRHAVERFPHFIAFRGREGEVVEATLDLVSVRMDVELAGAEEWDNEVVWTDADLPALAYDLEVIR